VSQTQPIAEEPEVLFERREGVAIITLNRPRLANTQGFTFGRSLLRALDEAESDPEMSVIVLTGAGKVFCGGGRIGENLSVEGGDPEKEFVGIRDTFRAVQRVRELELPVICALNGAAIGGGAALAMACDLVVAAEGASYAFPFGMLGASAADMGCSYMLPRLVGTARARKIILTGATISAAEGLRDGLFAAIEPRETLLTSAIALAQQIRSAGPRRAVAATKLALIRGETTEYATAVSYELYMQNYMLNTTEHKKRLRSFVDGRKAKGPAA
jgi:2-(1,2-epoxy-1,2-dihydrophenyl)acetyl-CoA isomerase